MIQILIVEDDPNIAKTIQATIDLMGHTSSVSNNGIEAISLIKVNYYDLILLDVMLPDLDGFEIMEQIQDLQIPTIFITAKQDVMDKVRGLRLGAEDYITKPFEVLELMARIEVVIRRMNKHCTTFTYKGIELDITKHRVTRNSEEITLTPKEFDLLTYFLQHLDIAITRERLLNEVWGYRYEGESRTVDIHIQQLRKKMGLANSLVTIPKLGYRLESENEIKEEL